MTLQQLKIIAEHAKVHDPEIFYPDGGEWEPFRDMYLPIREAIENNDMTTIAFLETCDKEVRRKLYTAIQDGLKDRAKQINEAVAFSGRGMDLYLSICEERGQKHPLKWLRS